MAATRGYPGYSRSSQARASFQARTSTASRVAASAGSSPSYPAGPPRSDQIEQRSAHCATHNSVTRKTSNSSRFSQVSSTTWFGSSVISGSWAMDLSVGGAWQLPPTTTPTIIVLPTRHRRALPNHGRKILPPTPGRWLGVPYTTWHCSYRRPRRPRAPPHTGPDAVSTEPVAAVAWLQG